MVFHGLVGMLGLGVPQIIQTGLGLVLSILAFHKQSNLANISSLPYLSIPTTTDAEC